jgi:uncharacterized membrane protein
MENLSAWVTLTTVAHRTACSDGMSDFDYPYEIFLNQNGTILVGCCESNLYPKNGGEE